MAANPAFGQDTESDMIDHISNLGTLKLDPTTDWLQSEDVPIPFLDNKQLHFFIIIEDFEKKANAALIENIEKSVKKFLHLDSEYRKKVSNLIYEDYQSALEDADNIDSIEIKNLVDIWNYIHPKKIYIQQWLNSDDVYVCIICEALWDMGHGLHLVFKNGESLTKVGWESDRLDD